MKYKSAFTLVEVLLVLAILSAATFFFVPAAAREFGQNSIRSFAQEMESDIYVQQQNAYSGINNHSHGIAFFSDSYIVFEGSTYATAFSTETFDLEPGMVLSNINFGASGNELIFTLGGYKPVAEGSVTLSNSSESIQITVNSSGIIETL
ncbi:prepilin-type N-terminal cleavage/methylation domain-containing protein [Candidatus Dojkabacteria bacterium]|uniref:Prepilin-type N-terminal cleavage/methylation domain-containing protein n=1 Tax=Candidatus Dojkabacteria bacterium TaxID=2099670 RepID=A0A955IA89_9BACT|nr:prepilin-type N-terminal cleavage/methylation domain-containing protein [Candidatus Dojkabacteria bacterium]